MQFKANLSGFVYGNAFLFLVVGAAALYVTSTLLRLFVELISYNAFHIFATCVL